MCLKQVINHLSTAAPILRINVTCQVPARPSGDTNKGEADIDRVKVCLFVCGCMICLCKVIQTIMVVKHSNPATFFYWIASYFAKIS